MRVTIRGRQLPGRTFRNGAELRENVHVALQVRKVPEGLVAGDAHEAEWHTEVRIVDKSELRDFRGPAVQGKRGERFLYLTWGEVDGDTFTMFRRAKLMLEHIPGVERSPASAVAVLDLAGARGDPICGQVKPPFVQWIVAD